MTKNVEGFPSPGASNLNLGGTTPLTLFANFQKGYIVVT